MLNGRFDQYFPFETSQKPMYELLSLKEPMKKMITYESAHSPPFNETSKEVLKWFNQWNASGSNKGEWNEEN